MANLLINITTSPNQAIVGEKLTYTITVTNQENDVVIMGWLSDYIPLNLKYVASSCTYWPDENEVYCDYDFFQLEPGHSITRTIVLMPKKAGLITNKFQVSSWGSSGGTVEKTATTQVNPKSIPRANINLQGVISWTIPSAESSNSLLQQYIGERITWYLSGGVVIDGVLTSVKGNFAELRNVNIYSLSN